MLKNKTNEFKKKYSLASHFDEKSMHTTVFGTTTKNFSPINKTPSSSRTHEKKKSCCKIQKYFLSNKNVSSKLVISTRSQDQYLKNIIKMKSNHKKIFSLACSPEKSTKDDERNDVDEFKETERSENSIILQEDLNEKFISEIEKNSLFYCCKCFQYIFEIEKHRHFPNCEDKIIATLSLSKSIKLREIGLTKLQLISQLAQYTHHPKMKEIQTMLHKITRNQLVSYGNESRKRKSIDYLKLNEIMVAFVFTYENLVKNSPMQAYTCSEGCF